MVVPPGAIVTGTVTIGVMRLALAGDGLLSRLVIGALGFHEGPAILSRFPIEFQASQETIRDFKVGDKIEASLRDAANC